MLYFDYNGAHPPIRDILEKNLHGYFESYGNPSGISFFSQTGQRQIEEARRRIAASLSTDCTVPIDPAGLHFVSSGTEAIHQLVRTFQIPDGTAILSPCEHPAMVAAVEEHALDPLFLPIGKEGRITVASVEEALDRTPRPAFVSIIAVSNETGVIQESEAIAALCKKRGVPFLSDTIQAITKTRIDLSLFDGFTANGIKFGAGPGCAVLSIRPPKRAATLFRGGSQEDERRAGTENSYAILNFAEALALQYDRLDEKSERLSRFQKRIEAVLKERCDAIIVAEGAPRVTNTTFLILPERVEIDFLLMGLDAGGIVVSTGSSCKSRSRLPSELLMRMGYTEKEALRSIRISTGLYTTEEEIERFLERFVSVVESIQNETA